MRFEPGFASTLRQELFNLPTDIIDRIDRPGGLCRNELLYNAINPQQRSAASMETAQDCTSINAVTDRVNFIRKGIDALADGKVAFCVLCGGSGAKTGEAVALTRFKNVGLSLLGLKLMQSTLNQSNISLPSLLMITPSIRSDIESHLNTLYFHDKERVQLFDQFESVRLTPDNRLLKDKNGNVELHPTGHGDLPSALVNSCLFNNLQDVEHVIVTNVNNAGFSIDPSVVGWHIEQASPVTCTVVKREQSDSGGFLAWVDGRLQIVESSFVPELNTNESLWHSTNTMIISVETMIDASKKQWRWSRVRKNPDNRIVVQYERALSQVTEFYDSHFCEVERSEHYDPIKEDLDRVDRKLVGK